MVRHMVENFRATCRFFVLVSGFAAMPVGSVCVADDMTDERATSPDGRLSVEFRLDDRGSPRYSIQRDGKLVLQESQMGLLRDDADFTKDLRLVAASPVESVADDYEILTSKRRLNRYRANRRVFHLETASGNKLDVVFQISNDGVAFRYVFPEQSDKLHQLSDEVTSFHFLPGTKAWLQPMSVAKSGWEKSNPSYEEYYEQEIAVGAPSPLGAGWVFPALFRSGDVSLLVSECGLGRNYCGGRLRSESPNGEYQIGFADPREVLPNGAALPESTLPWSTPWRIIVVGDLKMVAESTLGVDLADPPAVKVGGDIRPGKAAWSWPLLGDSNTTFDVQ
jgi:alpha-glucosidase